MRLQCVERHRVALSKIVLPELGCTVAGFVVWGDALGRWKASTRWMGITDLMNQYCQNSEVIICLTPLEWGIFDIVAPL